MRREAIGDESADAAAVDQKNPSSENSANSLATIRIVTRNGHSCSSACLAGSQPADAGATAFDDSSAALCEQWTELHCFFDESKN